MKGLKEHTHEKQGQGPKVGATKVLYVSRLRLPLAELFNLSSRLSPVQRLAPAALAAAKGRRRRPGLEPGSQSGRTQTHTDLHMRPCPGAFPARLLRSGTRGAGQESWSLRGRGCFPFNLEDRKCGAPPACCKHQPCHCLPSPVLDFCLAPRPALRAKSKFCPVARPRCGRSPLRTPGPGSQSWQGSAAGLCSLGLTPGAKPLARGSYVACDAAAEYLCKPCKAFCCISVTVSPQNDGASRTWVLRRREKSIGVVVFTSV